MRAKMAAVYLGSLLVIALLAGNPTPVVGVAHAQSTPSTEQDAIQLIRNYYRWINQKKYAGAFAIWEMREDGNAVNGQSFAKFKSGFSDTAAVSVEIGEPGEIEGAAGSNYIEIPVVISAISTSGKLQKFAGTYTMRSSNMADDHSWYIYSAKMKKVE